MLQALAETMLWVLPIFCFGYPFVMAWYWMAGGLLFYFGHERWQPPLDQPPPQDVWPPMTIIVPCYNEGENARETLTTAAAVDYPDFEIIAVNDGSRDNTAEVLDRLATEIPRLRVVHLAANQGKATAMNTGALLAKSEIIVCIDGDALLDPHALRWIAHSFRRGDLGALTGNPRIRNRTSMLGRLQVGEFSSIIGLIKRTQSVYGQIFTVSGVICAFRKRALQEAGWWSPRTLTDDIDVTWRIQIAGWRVVYQPLAIVWILMPETLRGLWKQRLRWAEGGVQMMQDYFWKMLRGAMPSLIPIYINYLLSVLWSYVMVLTFAASALWLVGIDTSAFLPQFSVIPQWWGLALAATYLMQAVVSQALESRYEKGIVRTLFWMIWYPLAFWMITTLTTVVALPRALMRPRKERTTWVSPDRGFR